MTGGPTFSLNGEQRPWTEVTVSALLSDAGVDAARGGVAVARNGEVVPRPSWDQTAVQPDDRIEIVHIVRGG
jgi:thiamine biosynthesis protein ThiS